MIDPNVASGLASLTAAVSAAPQLQGASTATLQPVLLAAQALADTINADIEANDPALDAASPDGEDPSIMALWLASIGEQAVDQSTLCDGGPYVTRIAINLGLGAT